jgi:2'-hydroxyisoflavone reductase
VAGTQPRLRWTTPQEVDACGLKPWSDLPVWVPPQGDSAGMHHTDTRRARDAGLRNRPLAQTVADTLAWYRGLPEAQREFTKAGLSPAREAEALAKLQA